MEEDMSRSGRRRKDTKYKRTGHTYRSSWRSYWPLYRYTDWKHGARDQVICVSHSSQQLDLARFVEEYLPGHKEVIQWEDNVIYSLNKKKRWDILEKVETAFTESAQKLVEEKFKVTVAVRHTENNMFKSIYTNCGPKCQRSLK